MPLVVFYENTRKKGGEDMKRPGRKELKQSEKAHIEFQLDAIRRMVRECSDYRMPQGCCEYCLEIYRAAINQALDCGVYE
jgi:hypothetical protein